MEELPIQGRNWMELSMMVKGVTSNDISNSRPGVGRDDQFQLNLDGQQITQQVAWANLFGQPRLSRESIAEYQVVTNMFDITMGDRLVSRCKRSRARGRTSRAAASTATSATASSTRRISS